MQIITPSLDRLGGPELEAIRIAKQRVCPDQQVQVNTPASADPTDYITVGVLGQPGCTAVCDRVTPDTMEDAMRRALWRDERPRLWIDLETKSGTDVKHGAYRYVEDPEFEILMASYAVDDGPVARVEGHGNVVRVLGPAVRSSEVLKVAHNAGFDRVALSRALLAPQEYLDPADWDDTAAHMVSHGWPASLKQGAEALGAEPKDTAGTKLINLFSLPPYADPAEHPQEWAAFGAYCDQDVATMRDMAHRFIARYGREWWTNEEREVWVQEQRINDRGVALDLELARCGDAADAIVKRKAAERITEITGIANPNSGPQWRQYLIEQHADEEFPDLDKRRITKAVEAGALDDRPVLKEALLLKLVATSKSASKFAAALGGVCADGRYRGSFKYHGAHTGRWSGKGLQLHNLSHDTFAKDFDENLGMTLSKVAACKAGEDLSGKELGMLIRPMMVGPFSVADFTGIEALVTGWLAGEQWVIDSFQDIKDLGDEADDIYVATGEKMGGELTRSEAKVATLACLPAGTPVTTPRGDVPIERLRRSDRVWDGDRWVRHQGRIYQGMKEVMSYDGLTATPDHLVWCSGASDPLPLAEAAERGSRLRESRPGGTSKRGGGSHPARSRVHQGVERPLRSGALRNLWQGVLVRAGEYQEADHAALRGVRGASNRRAEVADEADVRSEGSLHQSSQSRVQRLRRAGHRVPIRIAYGGSRMGYRASGIARPLPGDRSRQQRRALRARQFALGNTLPTEPQHAKVEPKLIHSRGLSIRGMAVRVLHRSPLTDVRSVAAGDPRQSRSLRRGEVQGLAQDPGTVAVYDVLAAGPQARYTASGKLVHNCGYSGGIGAMRRMGAESILPHDEMRAAFDKMLEEGGHELPATDDLPAQPLHEMHWPILKAAWGDAYIQQLVNSWRASNPRIVAFWDRLHAAVKHGGTAGAHIWVTKRGDERIVHLPSGRCLAYQRIGLGAYRVNVGTKKEPVYEQRAGLHRFTWRNEPVNMWSGLVTENVVQATARDFLAWALPRLAEADLPVVSHVHDEILIEDPEGSQTDRLAELMAADVPWARGLPLSAGAYTCPVYVKD